jgi:hypothetical protein
VAIRATSGTSAARMTRRLRRWSGAYSHAHSSPS